MTEMVNEEQIELKTLSENHCMIRTANQEIVLSYDAAYALAMQLAAFVASGDGEILEDLRRPTVWIDG